MKNKTNKVPYPYYYLGTFLKYHLEILINTYEGKKVEAFFNQCRFMKKRSQQNRYKMNLSFRECSEYKHKIKQVRNWIKEFDKERDLQKENERLKQQIEKMKCCGNCKFCDNDNPCFFHKEYRQCVDYSSWELAE